MRRRAFAIAGAVALALPGAAFGWSHSGAYGTASGGGGSWSASGYRGGTASGGGGSWQATGAYGTSAYGHAYYGGTYYGGTYSTYHPPTVVNSYYGSGCYDCGGWNTAGAAAVGGFLGARLAQIRAEQAAPAAPVYVMGGIYPTLPSGCTQSSQGGGSLYDCNGTWFSAAFGANGVYYRVVPAPAF